MQKFKLLLLLATTTILQAGNAQNLVPNGDMESYTVCPDDNYYYVDLATGWDFLGGHGGSSDYFHQCGSMQHDWTNFAHDGVVTPHGGNAYIGMITHSDFDQREYAMTQLSSPLVAGQEYEVTFWAYNANGDYSSDLYCNNIGIYLQQGMPSVSGCGMCVGVYNVTPQVNHTGIIVSQWTEVTCTIIAQGGEDWIVLGNFFNNAATATTPNGALSMAPPPMTAYTYIDDVVIQPITGSSTIDAGVDQTICNGGSATLNATTNLSGTITWEAIGGGFGPVTGNPVNVSPTVTTSYVVTIAGNCSNHTDTVEVVVSAPEDPSFMYPQNSYCLNETDPLPVITGVAGGTFSIDNGGVIDPNTGEVDLSATGIGSYTITYTTGGPCPGTTTFSFTIPAGADATILPAGPYCEGDAAVNLAAANGGGNWSGTGITNTTNGTFDPAVSGAGTFTITYTIPGGCGGTDTEDIEVIASDDASFSYAQGSYCLTDADPLPTITGISGGTFSIDNGGTIDPATGEVNISASGAGAFEVTYTIGGACPSSATFNLILTNGADATITQVGPYCEGDAVVNLSAANQGGIWAGNGITDVNAGTFDPSVAGTGNHTVDYVISGSCGDADAITIVVLATDDATFNYPQTGYCLTDPDPSPTVSGTTGGTFSINNGGVINSSTGEVDIAASGIGTFQITYTTNGTCPASETFVINLSNGADATISAAGPFCEGEGPVNLTGASGGGVWSGTGITDINAGTFDPSVAGAGSHQVTYVISGNCGDSNIATIIVNGSDDATISYSPTTYCTSDANPIAIIAGTQGGTFTIDNGGVIDPNTGEVDMSNTSTGTYVISYVTTGPCPDSTAVSIEINESADATLDPAGPFCEYDDEELLMAAQTGGTWSGIGVDPTTGEFDPEIAGPGIHQVVYTIGGACGDSDTISIEVNPAPNVYLGEDTLICDGCEILLDAGAGYSSYEWQDQNSGSTYLASEAGVYSVNVTDANGCTATDEIVLIYECMATLFAPNVFTPNSDGKNEVFYVVSQNVSEYSLLIFNRWGQLLFESNDVAVGWDGTVEGGTPVPDGVYVYVVKYKECDKTATKSKTGHVTVLR